MSERIAQFDPEKPGTRAGILCVGLLVSLLVVSLLGSPLSPGMAIGSLSLKVGSMWPAAVYLAAAFGLGWPVMKMLGATGQRRLCGTAQCGSPEVDSTGGAARRESRGKLSEQSLPRGTQNPTSGALCMDAVPIQFGVGLAIIFSLSEVLGVLGLLNAVTAIGVCVVGVGLVIAQAALAARAGARVGTCSLAWVLACPAVAVLIVAAAMPPGWLWGSEYGGFDALSYHLQLPQEWLAAGRIAPVEHNVYSYLPGYVEAAFTHLGWLTLAPERGLLGGDGWRLIACQGLHAGLTLAAVWFTARVAQRIARNLGTDATIARWAGAVAGCVMLATPWAVVTGSLAYNEAGVNAMLAAALLVCVQPRMSAAVRGGIVGVLVGVACGFKPTSLFFVGVPAGVVIVGMTLISSRGPTQSAGKSEPPTTTATSEADREDPGPISGARSGESVWRTLAIALGVGACVGTLALLPWLARNFMHGGNPVFPFAADLFGSAHWTAEQLDRYQAAHTFDGTAADRLMTALWASPLSSPGDAAVARFRGLTNPQWGLLLPMGLVAVGVMAAWWREARSIAALLAVALVAQLVAWLTVTHLQSRFLLPMLPLGAVLVGLVFARFRASVDERPDGRTAVMILAGVVIACQTGFLLVIYTSQSGGSPGRALAVFPTFWTGREADDPTRSASGWCNTRSPELGLVYLVGDSTPLYFGPDVVYHTTYDTSPLGAVMRANPDDPAAWADGLRERGIGWVLVNMSEIDRLQLSGWYDGDVTNDAVGRFAESLGGTTREWRDEGRYLVQIPARSPHPVEGTP